jgi:hypothetical protein
MTLTVAHPDPTKGISDVPDCALTFNNTILNNCDGRDKDNLWNFKWGGAYNDPATGWTFTMTAADITTEEDYCDATYEGLFDLFDIRGINLPSGDISQDGSGLESELAAACNGAISD